MKICAKCGEIVSENANYCEKCGAPLNVEEVCKIAPPERTDRVSSILSFAFALAGLLCALNCASSIWATLFFFLPSMIVFVALAKGFKKKHFEKAELTNNFIKASNALSIVAIPVCVVFTCISIISEIISFLQSQFFSDLVGRITVYINELLNGLNI